MIHISYRKKSEGSRYEKYSSLDFIEFEKSMNVDETETEISKIDLKGNVVDIGSGAGLYLKHLKPGFKKYIGIEPNEFLREHADKTAKKLGINSKFLKGFAEKIPLPDNSADVIISTYVFNELEHMKKIKKSLKEIRRIAKPGAKFIFCDLTGGLKDDYYNILNIAEVSRGDIPYREMSDVWIEVLLFLNKYARIEISKRVRLVYKFEDLEDAMNKTSAVLPDIKTNKKVREAIKKFYEKKNRLECEGHFIVARFK